MNSLPVPATREFTLVGVCYALYVFGLFLPWLAIIGVLIAYIRRDSVTGTVLESHYRWLVGTFWRWLVAWTLIIGAMAIIVVPHAIAIGELVRAGDYLSVPWEMIATAVAGGIALSVVWLWVAIRLFRGTLRLADGRTIP